MSIRRPWSYRPSTMMPLTHCKRSESVICRQDQTSSDRKDRKDHDAGESFKGMRSNKKITSAAKLELQTAPIVSTQNDGGAHRGQ